MIKKQIFGLDISDYSIEVLVLTKPFFGKPKIESYARTILRGDVISNGIIKKPDKLAESLTALLKSAQPKPIKSRYCVISLPESQVFSTVFKLPAGLKYNEIKNTIPFKAEEVIPFKSSEVYFDFKRIGVIGQSQEIFYVAIPIKIVDAYVEVFEKAGLIPVAFDLESNSLARSLIDVSKKSDGAKLLLDIGARTTNLNIFDNNGIRQSLTIKIAGDRFTKAIASKLNIKPKDASDLKMKNGFDAEKQDGKVLLVLQNEFKRIIAETKKFVEYYKSDYGRGVSEVILVGGSSFLPKVDQYLADNLEIETNIGKPFGKIADPRELVNLKGKSVLFANVAGLALRGLDKNPIHCDINLLPVVPVQFSLAPAKEDRRAWLEVYIRLGVLIILI
ncbi:type IV pilus assembly protein PilM, partial [Candidatus Falkowbacteria bacterium]|nr:type IV pilus assembly protein PilM [Candidatus Falkowbacteria bacterium]